jgi:type IV pilus assembly protein PilM
MRFTATEQDKCIGVDIGSHSVKVCQVNQGRKEIQLKKLGLAHLPPTAIVNGVIKDPQVIAETLQSLLSHLQLKNKEVAFAIYGYSVIIKKIALPVMSEKELVQSIEYEAQEHIPFDIKEVNLDFHILPTRQPEQDTMSVLLAAAKKETLNAYLDIFQLAGLKAVVADVAAFALANAYEVNYPTVVEPVALVNLGAEQITLHILNQDGPVFTREIFSGGRRLTEQIQKTLHLGFEEAEKRKLGAERSPEWMDRIAPSFLSVVRSWSEEIRQVFDVLGASDPENKPVKVLLSGGSSLLPGLPQLLSKGLQLPVELFDPFLAVRSHPDQFDPEYLRSIGPQMAVALGLALRGGPKG